MLYAFKVVVGLSRVLLAMKHPGFQEPRYLSAPI
jgi:hypothetical protein